MRSFGKDSKDEGRVKELDKGGLGNRFKPSSTLTDLSAPKSAARAHTVFAKILNQKRSIIVVFLVTTERVFLNI